MSFPPPAAPYRPPYQPPKTGMVAWGMGLIVLCCVPFVGTLAAAVAMIWVGLAQADHGSLARANGRRAANLGLSYLIVSVVLVGLHLGLLWWFTHDGSTIRGFFPFGFIILAWGLVSLGYVVLSVVGMVKASRHQVYAAPAVRFFRV